MISAASVKNRLANKAKASGKTMQELLIMYCLERTLYRLSISKYSDKFTLKGGVLLYALFDGNYTRTTADVDLLAEKISNDVLNMYDVFREIISVKADDPIRYDLASLKVETIIENKKYHGLNVSLLSFLDKTKVNISIDIGFGDVIYPNKIKMDYPVILDDDNPNIYVYSLYSCIAEKFEAIVSLGYENSRLKDFYDTYVIANSFDLKSNELIEAIKGTFSHRNTNLDTIVVFESNFIDDTMLKRWNSFIKKKRAMIKISLKETIDLIGNLLIPVVDAIKLNNDFHKLWNHSTLKWESLELKDLLIEK